MNIRVRTAISLAIVATIALGGCDFFRPADPEPPPAGQILVPIYTSIEATLETLELGIEAKSASGASAYIGGFADSLNPSTPAFHQFFWFEDEAAYEAATGGDAPDWTYLDEQTFYGNLVNSRLSESFEMEWDVDDSQLDDVGTEVARIHRRYRITALTEFTAQIIAIGYADLTLIKNDQDNWVITIWDDRRDSDRDSEDPEQQTLGLRRLNLLGGS